MQMNSTVWRRSKQDESGNLFKRLRKNQRLVHANVSAKKIYPASTRVEGKVTSTNVPSPGVE